MKARTLVAVAAPYNSAGCRYIVTVTKRMLGRTLHRGDDGLLPARLGNVVEEVAPGRAAVAALDGAVRARQRQGFDRQAVVFHQGVFRERRSRPAGSALFQLATLEFGTLQEQRRDRGRDVPGGPQRAAVEVGAVGV